MLTRSVRKEMEINMREILKKIENMMQRQDENMIKMKEENKLMMQRQDENMIKMKEEMKEENKRMMQRQDENMTEMEEENRDRHNEMIKRQDEIKEIINIEIVRLDDKISNIHELMKGVEEKQTHFDVRIGAVEGMKLDMEMRLDNQEKRITDIKINEKSKMIVNSICNNQKYEMKLPKYWGQKNRNEFLMLLETNINRIRENEQRNDSKEMNYIESCMDGIALKWWLVNRTDIETFEICKERFINKFWSKEEQNDVRYKLEHQQYGKFGKYTRVEYFLSKVLLARSLTPKLTDEEIVSILARHFPDNFAQYRVLQGIKNIEEMEKFLAEIDREERSFKTSYNNNRYQNQTGDKEKSKYGKYETEHTRYDDKYKSRYSNYKKKKKYDLRLCAAREAVEMEKLALDKVQNLSTKKHFDSNCILPGTVFLARLYRRIQFFVKQKITIDPLWAGCKVLLSGHKTPGEGEHKIMEYIRWARSQEGYDPNTRHCLYGMDADLIILAMCTHDPHFALLRKEVLYSVNVEQQTQPEEINFFLLHISLMREYLEQEFIGLKEILPFEYDLEKILDDWVLMSLLLGNDFIPNLPNLDILQSDALPVLYKTYIKVLPLLDGYINEAGDLHLGRFEVFMQELANLDKKAFLDNSADIQLLGSKTKQQPNGNVRTEVMKEDKKEEDVDKNEVDTFNREFVLHKRDYYMNKLRYPKVTKEVLKSQAECYVRAIQWNLHYYYRGCVSWSWYYPHHYAPYMSDIKGFKDTKLQYDLGTPFKPFEQLLAVLPSQSRELLPAPFHKLMTDAESPILQYYSLDFETDLNGKKNEWEAVVLLPPIDENLLLSAMEPCYAQLSAEERQRNTQGPMLMYTYTKEVLEEVAPLSNRFHALEKAIWREELHVSEQNLKRGRLPNALSHLFFPGVPTMRHLKYHSRIELHRPGQKCCVKVFNQPSRHDNMIIMLESQSGQETDKPCLKLVAQELLGRVVWVGWPYLSQAKVISVSNQQLLYRYTPDDESTDSIVNVSAKRNVTKESTREMKKRFRLQKNNILQHTMGRMGIDVGEVDIIVHAVNLRGHTYVMEKNAAFVVKPEWCVEPCGYALQAVVQDLAVHSIPALTKYNSVQEAFNLEGLVFVMTREYYGCQAKVISSSAAVQKGYIEVLVSEDTEPSTTPSVISEPNTTYMTEYQVADRCGLSPQLVTRITGKIFVIDGEDSGSFYGSNRTFIGLDLKFHQQNLEVMGYTRKINNNWLYSERCLELIRSYTDQFPDMFNRMSTHQNINKMFEYDLWPDQVGAGKPKEVVAWLKQQAHKLADQRESPSVALEEEELASLAVSVDTQLPHLDHDKCVPLQVKIHLLYKPDLHEGNLPPDPEADFQLYDRVVNVNNTIEVPLGAKGTITAIYLHRTVNSVHSSDNLNVETSYQVLFDTAFSGGDEKDGVEGTRFYRLNASSLLNISYGRNLRDTTYQRTAKQHADDKSIYLQTEYLNWFKEYNNQHDQLTQNHRHQTYQNNQYQKKEQSNWRFRVLETDEGHNSASPTEKTQCNQNKVQLIQNPRPESTNIGQRNNNNVAPSSDNTASASDSSQSNNSETGSNQHKTLMKNKSSPVKVSLKPAKVLSNNWRRDSEEHQRIQSPLSTVTNPLRPSTLTQNPLSLPSHLSSMSQPPLTHQTSYQYRRPPVYQPMQQVGRMGLGSVADAFPVQPNIPNKRSDTKKKTKHGKGSRTPE